MLIKIQLSTHTIVFDIVDKYMNSSSITATNTSMIHVYLDGEEAASMTKPSTVAEQNANADKIFKEITSFVGSRILSLLMDMGAMAIMVTLLRWNDVIGKIITQVIVTIANYIFSKIFVFKKKD